MLFCWKLKQNLCYSFTNSRNLFLYCPMDICVPSHLLKNIFPLSSSSLLSSIFAVSKFTWQSKDIQKKIEQTLCTVVKLLLLQQHFTSLNKLLICPNKDILGLPYNSGSFLPTILLLHVPGIPCSANQKNQKRNAGSVETWNWLSTKLNSNSHKN